MANVTSKYTVGEFVKALSAKQATPGGGAAAAVTASIGSAAATMAANYSQRKKDIESGGAVHAAALVQSLNCQALIGRADDDAAAYANLQRSWKTQVSADEKALIEARALHVPTNLVEVCHQQILEIKAFLPHCNPNIVSDAKVGIVTLAGAARSAFCTVLVNAPPETEIQRLKGLLREIREIEEELLDL